MPLGGYRGANELTVDINSSSTSETLQTRKMHSNKHLFAVISEVTILPKAQFFFKIYSVPYFSTNISINSVSR